MAKLDFIGRKFGKLAVIAFDQKGSAPHKQRWICKCDCGTEKSILRNNLTQGCVKSCGCATSEYIRQNRRAKPPKDITGFVSGDLTVVEMVPNTHPPRCRCICKCGNETIVDARSIRYLRTKSCGCGVYKLRKNLVGQKFDKLTVVSRADNYRSPTTGQTQVQYLCRCDCGGQAVVSASALQQGLTRSCGCIRSMSERRLENFFQGKGIRFLREYKFKDCKDERPLPFDFAILDKNDHPIVLIELDGIQHYVPTFNRNMEYVHRHDKTKTKYCSDHKIPLIRIPYWDLDEVENVVLKEIQPYVNEYQSIIA